MRTHTVACILQLFIDIEKMFALLEVEPDTKDVKKKNGGKMQSFIDMEKMFALLEVEPDIKGTQFTCCTK